jgi:hypothetical protein
MSAGRRRGPGNAALSLGLLSTLIQGTACEPGAHTASARGARQDTPSSPAPVAPPTNPATPLTGDDAPSLRALEPCVPVTYEVCFNALDDNCNGALEEGCGIPAGVVQFVIGWDAMRVDVDLNVTDPNGELIEAGRVARSGLIKTRDCPGRRQECGGMNLENVFLEGNKAPTRGTYRVSVALESLGGEQPPVWVNLSSRLGSKRYAFEIRLQSPEDERHVELTL